MKTGHIAPHRVSFVIPVRNDAARLERCIRSVLDCRYPSASLEILVIDNGSTDSSAAVATRLGATVLSMPHGRVAELRNEGARRARGQVLAFVDADHEIAPGWIHVAAECLMRPHVAAVGALCSAPPDGTWVQRAYGEMRGCPNGQQDVEWLGGGNLAVLKSRFDAAGGFDTSLDTCEDVDLCNRLRTAGLRIVSDARLVNVHHGDPATLAALFKGELWRGRDNLRVSLRSTLSARALPSIVIPIFHLVMAAAGLAAALFAVMGSGAGLTIAATAMAAVLIPTCLRAARTVWTSRRVAPDSIAAVFAVAGIYDAARALALIARMPHHRKQHV